jgi:hypothetical protein
MLLVATSVEEATFLSTKSCTHTIFFTPMEISLSGKFILVEDFQPCWRNERLHSNTYRFSLFLTHQHIRTITETRTRTKYTSDFYGVLRTAYFCKEQIHRVICAKGTSPAGQPMWGEHAIAWWRHSIFIRSIQWAKSNSELELRHSKGGREDGQGKGKQHGKQCVSECETKNILSLLISTQLVVFWCTDFYTTLYFMNQRKFKIPAMQAHALTRTSYF